MLKQRILTALVLLPLMVGMLFAANEPVWAGFAALVTLLALWEFGRMMPMSKPFQAAYLLLSFGLLLAAYLSGFRLDLRGHYAVLAFWLLLVPVWLYAKWTVRSPWWAALLGWALLLPFWLALVSLRPNAHAAAALLAIMALVWVADTGAYAFGRLFGRHKLAPAISPGKSWEGAIGGLACVLLYVWLMQKMQWFAVNLPLWQALLVAVVLTAVSIQGDLLESWLKRAAGVKDSSQLLPGHGGVFDRTDSLIAVLSVYAALMAVVTTSIGPAA